MPRAILTWGSQYGVIPIESTYLPNAEIPTQCLNPVISAVLKKYVGVPNILLNTDAPQNVSIARQPKDDKNVLARIDWNVNAKHTIDARYNLIYADDQTSPGVNSASLGIATFDINANKAISNFGNIGDTWILTPNIVNILRAGYKRYALTNPPAGQHDVERIWRQLCGAGRADDAGVERIGRVQPGQHVAVERDRGQREY